MIKIFTAQRVELTDGSELYEVVTLSGERIASFEGPDAEEESDSFADALNDVCDDAPIFFGSNFILNV